MADQKWPQFKQLGSSAHSCGLRCCKTCRENWVNKPQMRFHKLHCCFKGLGAVITFFSVPQTQLTLCWSYNFIFEHKPAI